MIRMLWGKAMKAYGRELKSEFGNLNCKRSMYCAGSQQLSPRAIQDKPGSLEGCLLTLSIALSFVWWMFSKKGNSSLPMLHMSRYGRFHVYLHCTPFSPMRLVLRPA